MRKEFNELVSTLKRWDLYHKNDEVYIALTDLEKKIDEVMKRIDCAMRSNQDSNSIVMQFVDGFQDEGLVKQTLNHIDFETLQRSVYDVDVALNLNDTECIDNNWYELFESKEELKSIEVDNIEYDFPEAVFTIGNADNTEFVADVYDSDFAKLIEFGVIIFEGAEDFIFGKANYIVCDNNFIPMVKLKEIDLSTVPIKNEEFITFESSWGYISCDKDGNILNIDGEEEIDGERSYLYDIAKFDLVEYGKFCESKNIVMGEFGEDILAVGFWKKDGTYEEADMEWRKNIFGEADDEIDAPTELCKTPQTHEFVKDIIAKLKVIDVDGETMEYILEQVGMKEQVLKQLFSQTTNDDDKYAEGGRVKNIWVYSKPMDKKIRFSAENMSNDSWIDTKSVVNMSKKEIEVFKKQYNKYGKVYIYDEKGKYAEGGETGDDENFEYWIYQNYPTFDIDTFHLQEFLEEHYENSLTYNENFKNLQEWLDDDSENDDIDYLHDVRNGKV